MDSRQLRQHDDSTALIESKEKVGCFGICTTVAVVGMALNAYTVGTHIKAAYDHDKQIKLFTNKTIALVKKVNEPCRQIDATKAAELWKERVTMEAMIASLISAVTHCVDEQHFLMAVFKKIMKKYVGTNNWKYKEGKAGPKHPDPNCPPDGYRQYPKVRAKWLPR